MIALRSSTILFKEEQILSETLHSRISHPLYVGNHQFIGVVTWPFQESSSPATQKQWIHPIVNNSFVSHTFPVATMITTYKVSIAC